MERKYDDAEIAALLDSLAEADWLTKRQQNWPRYVYHITDVRNAASILASGVLVCRSAALHHRLMRMENAGPSVIEHHDPDVFEYVRLFFRPRTPTFYLNEGIRPIGRRAADAHCPMPVALLFDAKHVLGLRDARFTDGAHNTRNRPPLIGNDIEFLRRMPWQLIYGDDNPTSGKYSTQQQAEMRFRRQAEVQVLGRLVLDGLRHVFTRSQAERETLWSLLGDTRNKFTARIRDARPQSALFFNHWAFVERVVPLTERLGIMFNLTEESGPFRLEVRYSDLAGRVEDRTHIEPRCVASSRFVVPIPGEFNGRPFRLTLTLDDSLAYRGDITPFPAGSQLIK